MKKAGYSSGKYTGPPLLTVADNQSPAKKTGEALQAQLAKLGFKLQLPRGAARDDAHEVLRRAEGGRRDLPEPRLGQGLLRLAEHASTRSSTGRTSCRRATSTPPRSTIRQLNAEHGRRRDSSPTPTAAREGLGRPRQGGDQGRPTIIPWLWDNEVNFASTNVNGVVEQVQLSHGTSRSAHSSSRIDRADGLRRSHRRGRLAAPRPPRANRDPVHHPPRCCGWSCCCSWSAHHLRHLLRRCRRRTRPCCAPAASPTRSWSSRSATTSASTSRWYQQYFDYMKRLVLHCDFGYSYQNNISVQHADLRPAAGDDLARGRRGGVWLRSASRSGSSRRPAAHA